MDPETALQLVRNGSTLLLFDVPQHTLLGIDTQVFSVGPMFMGIKMIPPGVHFVYYCSSSRDREFSPAVGFYFESAPSEVVIRKWNVEEERLVKLSDEEVNTVEEQVRASAEHKLGVANQSITAGFFDNNTSAEDRREYLEALLRESKTEEAAPVLDDDALNDILARRLIIFHSIHTASGFSPRLRQILLLGFLIQGS